MKTIINKDEFRGLSPESPVEDAVLTNYLNTVTDLIHSYAGYSLEESEITEYKLGSGGRALYLDRRPVKSVSKVVKNDAELATTEYRHDDRKIELVSGAFFKGQDFYEATAGRTTKSDRVEITYTAGFVYPEASEDSSSTVPWDLKLAVVGVVNSFVTQMASGGQASALKSYSISDVSYSFRSFAEANEPFMSTIERYMAW